MGHAPLIAPLPCLSDLQRAAHDADAWYGLLAPAGTSDAVVKLLQREALSFAASAAGADKLRSLGMVPQPLCGDAFASQLTREVSTHSQIAKELDLKVE